MGLLINLKHTHATHLSLKKIMNYMGIFLKIYMKIRIILIFLQIFILVHNFFFCIIHNFLPVVSHIDFKSIRANEVVSADQIKHFRL